MLLYCTPKNAKDGKYYVSFATVKKKKTNPRSRIIDTHNSPSAMNTKNSESTLLQLRAPNTFVKQAILAEDELAIKNINLITKQTSMN